MTNPPSQTRRVKHERDKTTFGGRGRECALRPRVTNLIFCSYLIKNGQSSKSQEHSSILISYYALHHPEGVDARRPPRAVTPQLASYRLHRFHPHWKNAINARCINIQFYKPQKSGARGHILPSKPYPSPFLKVLR